MNSRELLGIGKSAAASSLDKKPSTYGKLSIAAPIVLCLGAYILYLFVVTPGGDSWGFGLLVMLLIGLVIGNGLGFLFSVISFMRNESPWWYSLAGLILNLPSLILFSSILFAH